MFFGEQSQNVYENKGSRGRCVLTRRSDGLQVKGQRRQNAALTFGKLARRKLLASEIRTLKNVETNYVKSFAVNKTAKVRTQNELKNDTQCTRECANREVWASRATACHSSTLKVFPDY